MSGVTKHVHHAWLVRHDMVGKDSNLNLYVSTVSTLIH